MQMQVSIILPNIVRFIVFTFSYNTYLLLASCSFDLGFLLGDAAHYLPDAEIHDEDARRDDERDEEERARGHQYAEGQQTPRADEQEGSA